MWAEAKIRRKVRSQWSTFESGPLARSETGVKGWKLGICQELVVHSVEWTTGWVRN